MSALDVALLRALRAANVHLPVSELATQLATPAATLCERIAELRIAGFEIDERPALGFRLIASPDRLIADDLLARLGENDLVRDVVVFEETTSTNDRAAALGRDGSLGGVAIFAETQSAGRGRFGRRWESASHLGLWFSLLLRPELPFAEWPRLTTWAAVSIAAALEEMIAARVQIKWPNDVQIAQQKVAGLLMETGVDRNRVPFAVLGIGVNVNHTTADFPPELEGRAGSLRQAASRMLDRAEVAVAILRALEARRALSERDFEKLVDDATRRSSLLGKWIQVRAGADVIDGLAQGLTADGHLILRDRNGEVRTLSAGEVTLAI